MRRRRRLCFPRVTRRRSSRRRRLLRVRFPARSPRRVFRAMANRGRVLLGDADAGAPDAGGGGERGGKAHRCRVHLPVRRRVRVRFMRGMVGQGDMSPAIRIVLRRTSLRDIRWIGTVAGTKRPGRQFQQGSLGSRRRRLRHRCRQGVLLLSRQLWRSFRRFRRPCRASLPVRSRNGVGRDVGEREGPRAPLRRAGWGPAWRCSSASRPARSAVLP